ncbi:hypothetical protein A2313_03340 [Candidatus Roizmanbacteria bacterium RIFOXYB2_FULL_41_10]|uniref:Uncharacterized protein n=1 Tax=Candidatus Roizmanbacteria bacterium RIFOXYA1_FULL_41_12 TaxID=1802082 RepID=A0A1F7KGD9_9BACT|nr:MAG: hypothetical protein A2377_04055 [Candidatus Roizmanbacteria bacterium RIFOXYB1_FULL_41_27]OGK66494.1 MAG: hypothetical protein A2262_02360 [Candidatus Roizmanbacteria bacterium RIFOXYA2_FULL_41_8]OGK66935.1 MAG: hypothetical protein A2209_02670 [Candidatus Roizmanbacteria bacterium RIFOXYA1_FULL_41_12]OGK72280.1 MAG: hypothetical protein A2313_03340 [Candidatus Roizmanbacteria bacterium RIFOXYB2_FULL_41_10]OGK72296.1 MAG: hypothetical protein A2403_00045 [Candidatus Roizmanbacteria bac
MIIGKFKAVIEPLQMWLLKSGRCVGCGKEILKSSQKKSRNKNEDLYTCECKRAYILDKKKKTFRRALLKELA